MPADAFVLRRLLARSPALLSQRFIRLDHRLFVDFFNLGGVNRCVLLLSCRKVDQMQLLRVQPRLGVKCPRSLFFAVEPAQPPFWPADPALRYPLARCLIPADAVELRRLLARSSASFDQRFICLDDRLIRFRRLRLWLGLTRITVSVSECPPIQLDVYVYE